MPLLKFARLALRLRAAIVIAMSRLELRIGIVASSATLSH